MAQAGPAIAGAVFAVDKDGDTIIAVPVVDLRELDYRLIEEGASQILDLLNGTGMKNVVLDFHKTDYFGSTALAFFTKLWKRVRGQNGRMAFCNVSIHEKEVLKVTGLDHLWPICPSRAQALETVRK
jgi:anti-anti-sigma factor